MITASPVASKTASGENNIEAQHIYNYITAGPTTSLLDGENLNIASGSSRSSSSGNLVTTGGGEKPRFSFWTFALDVLRLHDVVGTLTYKSDLYQNVDQGDGELR